MARVKSDVAATFRLWHSSPICKRLGRDALEIDRPGRRASTRASVGPSVCAIQRRRSSTEASYAPKRSTLPSPSLRVAKARLPSAAFSTTSTGIEGDTTPAIGPTAPCSWHGVEGDAAGVDEPTGRLGARRPALEQDGADRGALHRPAHALPLDRRPGVQERAAGERGHRLTRRPDVDERRARRTMRAIAVSLADRTRAPIGSSGSSSRRATSRPSSRSPPAGGRQSSCVTLAPWARGGSANAASPTLIAWTPEEKIPADAEAGLTGAGPSGARRRCARPGWPGERRRHCWAPAERRRQTAAPPARAVPADRRSSRTPSR